MTRSGPELALLLLGSYRKLVDAAVVELAARGFEDVRPVHDFALRAIAAGADSASDLGRRLAVSKQAAAKTIVTLLERGYVAREADPIDRRRKRIEVTPLGLDVIRTGEGIMDELRAGWSRQLGEPELETLEAQLRAFVGSAPVRTEAPGWVALELDGR
ncbi:MAG TPA: MarR family transcriptional regulator [Acidimicrobiales bacterium]|jgi:DNA-binding MarR family transcriptional regulator|nr:MarR family transcriptional regulator [Acidimicrobiales bacterium]